MTSPFAGFDNAILTFKVSDGTFTINALGNRIPNVINAIIKAVLKESTSTSDVTKYAQEIQQFAGADGRARLLEGYLVDPLTYPDGVKFLAEADIVIATSLGVEETGRFKLLPILQSPYVVASNIGFITPIKGIIRS